MKTTDGYNLKKNGTYYLVSGQMVLLLDWMKGQNHKVKYLVSYLYEGTAMDVNCYGGDPVFSEMDYEFEGDETIVHQIYEVEPVTVMGQNHRKAVETLKTVSIELEDARSQLLKNEIELKCIIQTIDVKSDILEELKNKEVELLKYVQDLTDNVEELQSLYKSREDGIRLNDDIEHDKELAYLRQRDFKLSCLEGGGVDNWSWYYESLSDYRKEYPL